MKKNLEASIRKDCEDFEVRWCYKKDKLSEFIREIEDGKKTPIGSSKARVKYDSCDNVEREARLDSEYIYPCSIFLLLWMTCLAYGLLISFLP